MKYILLALILIFTFNVQAKTLKYKITSGDKNLGELIVTYNEDKVSNTFQVSITSNITFELIATISLKYKLNTVFKNNKLLYSSVTTYVNNKLHSSTITNQKEANYTVTKDKHSSLFMGNIMYSGALLYIKEPINFLKGYSEVDGFYKPIKKLGEHKYQIINPKNGQINEYIYKRGILQEAIVHHRLMKFKMTLQ